MELPSDISYQLTSLPHDVLYIAWEGRTKKSPSRIYWLAMKRKQTANLDTLITNSPASVCAQDIDHKKHDASAGNCKRYYSHNLEDVNKARHGSLCRGG